MNKKGFTLIEILFVLLIIALVVSFAVPAIRSVRYDIRNSQAKAGLKKLLDARKSFYQNTKGLDIKEDSSFIGTAAKGYSAQACSSISTSGIPATALGHASPEQLFSCGFANWKDFSSSPYTFYFCDHWTAGSHAAETCQLKDADDRTMAMFAYIEDGQRKLGGDKYFVLEDGSTRYYMAIGWDGQIYENLE